MSDQKVSALGGPGDGKPVGHLSLRNITKRFGEVLAVDEVSAEVASGEFFTLLGPSGCGKTTLLRMIAGFEYPTAGDILLEEMDLTALPPERRPLNMVFQRYALFPHMDVHDNVAYGLRTKGMAEDRVRKKVREALELVDMTALARRSVKKLSGGQSQRVALARALVNEPRLLLLDEPLGALDLQLRKRMQMELRSLQERLGMTFVYVTHDQEEAFMMSHRIAIMEKGQIIQVGSPAEIYQHPRSRFVAAFVGETTFVPCTVMAFAQDAARVRLDVNDTTCLAYVPSGVDMGQGTRAALSLRPESLWLTAQGQGQVDGTLIDVIFLGSTVRRLVRLSDGVEVKVHGPLQTTAQQGDTVGVAWEDRSCVLVEEEM